MVTVERPLDAPEDGRMDELAAAVVVEFPLRGEWSVERTPAHRIPSHGTDLFGQRFAYDLVRTDHRRGFHPHPAGNLRGYLLGGRTRDCHGWGQPVYAAVDGEIVAAVDGVSERQWLHVARESWFAFKSMLALARGRLDPARLAGNHVIVRSGETYTLYAHLAPGSVAVTQGQVIRAGEQVGRVGHTGNSTAPHLHLQLMDTADPLRAKGIPCAFAEYLVECKTGWERVRAGSHAGSSASAPSASPWVRPSAHGGLSDEDLRNARDPKHELAGYGWQVGCLAERVYLRIIQREGERSGILRGLARVLGQGMGSTPSRWISHRRPKSDRATQAP